MDEDMSLCFSATASGAGGGGILGGGWTVLGMLRMFW